MKRSPLPILAAVVAFSAIVAAAASLGGITGDDLGSDNAIVASCDSDGVEVSYNTSYDADTGSFVVESVDVSDIAAPCVGQDLDVVLADASGDELTAGSAVVAGTSETVIVDEVSAGDVEAASILITGPA